MGLRERKKQQTRELLAATARRLFTERGFERVSVAEIAREADESVLDAFVRFVSAPRGMLASPDEDTRERLAALSRMIAASPALLAREQQIFAGYTDSLAALLAVETDTSGIEPWVVANALMGVHRALVSFARERIVQGA